jgi:hypothetical protein
LARGCQDGSVDQLDRILRAHRSAAPPALAKELQCEAARDSPAVKLMIGSAIVGRPAGVSWRFVKAAARFLDGAGTYAVGLKVNATDRAAGFICVSECDDSSSALHRAFLPTSVYYWELPEDYSALGLSICYRTRFALAHGLGAVMVNGYRLADLAPSPSWVEVQLIVPARHLRSGINEAVLRWPARSWQLKQWNARQRLTWLRGGTPPPTPLWGEVYRLALHPLGMSANATSAAAVCGMSNAASMKAT